MILQVLETPLICDDPVGLLIALDILVVGVFSLQERIFEQWIMYTEWQRVRQVAVVEQMVLESLHFDVFCYLLVFGFDHLAELLLGSVLLHQIIDQRLGTG